MRGTLVYKMTGSGNDFVFVDGRTDPLDSWSPERIAEVCTRRTGLGADGLVVIEPGSGAGVVRFHFFNRDGGRAPMCGNAALCATRLAAHLELAPAHGMVLETDAGRYGTRCLTGTPDRAAIELGDVLDVASPQIPLGPGERRIGFATVGVPHLVVLVDDLESIDLMGRGRALRIHPALGPAGANVNFVCRADQTWSMRTYERGVEGETLACGTGAVASAAVLGSGGGVSLPWDVVSRSGQPLTVTGHLGAHGIRDSELAGEGRLVFRAIL